MPKAFAAVAVVCCLLSVGAGGAAARQAVAAADGPGALSHFDLARKDCLGTARNTTSKVWYTVAGGVLSDVYYPTIDNTNVETLQYVVTDGSSFTDLQTRDMTYSVESIDRSGMECRVTANAKSGRYRIVTDYLTDPDRNTLLMRVRFEQPGRGAPLALYVRFDPTVNGNGGGGSGNGGADSATIDTSTGNPVLVSSDPVTATNAANRDYAQPVFAALDGPFSQASSGFVGAPSDSLASPYTEAIGGNVVQTARVSSRDGKPFTLALGFGASQAEAVGAAAGSRASDFDKVEKNYTRGWKDYDKGLVKPSTLDDAYYASANVIKASEDKTFPGAIVARLTSPVDAAALRISLRVSPFNERIERGIGQRAKESIIAEE